MIDTTKIKRAQELLEQITPACDELENLGIIVRCEEYDSKLMPPQAPKLNDFPERNTSEPHGVTTDFRLFYYFVAGVCAGVSFYHFIVCN